MFYWSCKERRTRSQVTVPLSDVPAFAPAFQTSPAAAAPAAAAAPPAAAAAAAAPAAAAAAAPAAQQDAAALILLNAEDVAAGAAAPLLLDSETKRRLLSDEASRSRLNVLTVAGLFGGWWGPAAEQDDGAAKELVSLQHQQRLQSTQAVVCQPYVHSELQPESLHGKTFALLLE